MRPLSDTGDPTLDPSDIGDISGVPGPEFGVVASLFNGVEIDGVILGPFT